MKANKISFGINYIDTGSRLHRLNGITKFILFIAWITVVLSTFDLRVILLLTFGGLLLLKLTKVPLQSYRTLLVATAGVLLTNALFMFLLAPQQGSEYLGSATVIFPLFASHALTQETLFYLCTVTLKYFSMFPIALVFVFSTHPSEFAASLNRLGLPYKIAYAVSLTLRYLPEIKKDFVNIMHAQQARGLNLGKEVSFITRLKNTASILTPLIFSSLDRAENISNAMVLRGFGRLPSRTWYSEKPLEKEDKVLIVSILITVILAISYRLSSEQLFWYPF